MGNQTSSPVVATDDPDLARRHHLGSASSSSLASPLSDPLLPLPGSTTAAAGDVLSRRLDAVVPPQSVQPVCMLAHGDPLILAVQTFNRHNISSLPIAMGDGHGFEFLDVTDLMAFVSEQYGDDGNFSSRNPTLSVPRSATVGATLRQLVTHRAHRLLITDDANDDKGTSLYQVVTQTQLLRYLSTSLPPALASATLAEAQFFGTNADQPLRSVDHATPAFAAMAQCLAWAVHRVAVTYPASETGSPKLGVFGAWDVPAAVVAPHPPTARPVVPKSGRTQSPNPNKEKTVVPAWTPGPACVPGATVAAVCRPAATVDLDDPVSRVVGLLATRVREVFLVDGAGCPLHIITQGDCLRLILEHMQE
ncbi:hypothetical protein H9P43_007094 [Blastocladiella emersonii ATCC 22665]|nr:hypothetical protein H9P43_007094 [Blastocladiella emersonii ATCC 22665]